MLVTGLSVFRNNKDYVQWYSLHVTNHTDGDLSRDNTACALASCVSGFELPPFALGCRVFVLVDGSLAIADAEGVGGGFVVTSKAFEAAVPPSPPAFDEADGAGGDEVDGAGGDGGTSDLTPFGRSIAFDDCFCSKCISTQRFLVVAERQKLAFIRCRYFENKSFFPGFRDITCISCASNTTWHISLLCPLQ